MNSMNSLHVILILAIFFIFLLVTFCISFHLNNKVKILETLTLIVQEQRTHLYIVYDKFNDTITLPNYKGLVEKRETSMDPASELYVSDAFTLLQVQNSRHMLYSIIPDTKVILFICSFMNLKSLQDYNDTIYYSNDDDVPIIRIILLAHDNKQNQLVKTDGSEPDLQCVFIFNSLKNKRGLEYYSQNFNSTSLDYISNIDMTVVRQHIPFILEKSIMISSYLGNTKDFIVSQITLHVDMLLFGYKELQDNPYENDLLSEYIDQLNTFDKINLYGFYFNLFDQSKKYISSKNEKVKSLWQ